MERQLRHGRRHLDQDGPAELGFALRILHATDTGSLNGDTAVGTLGVDNVTALPEPSMAPLVVCGGGLAVAALVRRLKRSHGT